MSVNNIVGGTFYFFIDGLQYKARGNAKYCVATNEKESVVGVDGPHGFLKKPKMPWIEIDITDQGNLNTKLFQDMDDVTVTGENANGKTVVFRNATCTTPPEVDAIQGQFSVKFEAPDAEELIANG
jgi:hypothetical protein